MKPIRNAILCLLSALCILSLCACGDDNALPPYPKQELPAEKATGTEKIGDFTLTRYATYAAITAYEGKDPSPTLPTASGDFPVRYLGDSLFENNEHLTSITIPSCVLIIGRMAFRGCKNLTSVTFSEGNEQIGAYAFSGTGLTELHLPETMWGIGREAFLGTKLTEIRLPDSVSFVDDYAFHACKELKSAVLSRRLVQIQSRVFEGCTALTSVTFLGNVTDIEDYAFANCPMLKSIVIPPSVSAMGTGLFAGNETRLQVKKEGYATKWCASNAVKYDILTPEAWEAYEQTLEVLIAEEA